MKCTSCHTYLTEFGRFQKKVCPNCGNPVVEYNKKSAKYLNNAKAMPYEYANHLQYEAYKSRDAMIWSMLLCLISVMIIALSAVFIKKGGSDLPFWLYFVGALLLAESTVQSLFFFVRTLYLRRNISKAIRPKLSPALGLMFFGLIITMLVFMLAFGIRQNIEYNQNQHRFVDVDATITRIRVSGSGDDEEYDVYISYNFNGTLYEDIEYPHYKSNMREGNSIPIRIDPEDPGELPQKGTAFIIVTAILTPISLGALYLTIIRPLIMRTKERSL